MRKGLLSFLLFSSIGLVFTACEKGTEPFPPAENNEKTTVLLPAAKEGPIRTIALDLNPGVKPIQILEVKRNATSPADLNRRLVVKIKDQNAVLSDETSGDVERLPSNLFTPDPSTPFDGQYWTVTFEPGETTKFITILMDPSVLISLGKRVGFGFLIAEAQGATISNSASKLAVEISAKNPWDGVYRITGNFTHPDPCLTGPFGTSTTGGPLEMTLITIGANQVKRNMFNLENLIIYNNCAGGLTYFTNVIPAYQIETNNTVTVFGRPGNTVTYVQGNSTYNPATKTFTLNYSYLSTPNRIAQETMVYLRPR